jgi:hypothetical protein
MKKEEFDLVINALRERVEGCKKHLDGIQSTADLKNITIGQAVELRDFCVAEIEKMTKIVMVDLYHIIGMGKLSMPQMMKFTFLMKEYLSYRPNIKSISKGFDSITDLPKIPVKTKFKLLALCDLTLTTGEGADALEDNAAIDDYTALQRVEVQSTCFNIVGQTITVDMNRLDEFIQILTGITKTEGNLTTLINKIINRKEYFGISWLCSDDKKATGHVSPNSPVNKLK